VASRFAIGYSRVRRASKTTAVTGVKIDVYGFDTGKGLPPPRTYRDHPELYRQGDFPMA
jgi:hypothetical protein